MLHLPCIRHRPTLVNCVFNVSAFPVLFPACSLRSYKRDKYVLWTRSSLSYIKVKRFDKDIKTKTLQKLIQIMKLKENQNTPPPPPKEKKTMPHHGIEPALQKRKRKKSKDKPIWPQSRRYIWGKSQRTNPFGHRAVDTSEEKVKGQTHLATELSIPLSVISESDRLVAWKQRRQIL